MVLKKFRKFTIRNTNGTYRIPINGGIHFTIDSGIGGNIDSCMLGDIANRLGEYESIGSPEEFAELKTVNYDEVRVKNIASVF